MIQNKVKKSRMKGNKPHFHVFYPLKCDGCGVRVDMEAPGEAGLNYLGDLMFAHGWVSVVGDDNRCYAFCSKCQPLRRFKKYEGAYIEPTIYPYCATLHSGGTLCGERLTMHLEHDAEPQR